MGAWSIATAAASLVLLGALIATAVAAVAIVRLRRDASWAEAAERHEHVDLQYLAKQYVPLDLMTETPTTELPIIKQNIETRRRSWLRTIAASTLLSVVLAVPVTIGVRHELITFRNEAVRRAARAVSVNPTNDIQGTWGAPYNFLLSCAQNPHTIRLANEGQRLIVAFEKPPAVFGGENLQTAEFTIVDVQKNVITLGSTDDRPLTDRLGQPLLVKLILDDPNTYHISRSDQPPAAAITNARCPGGTVSGSR